MYLNICSRQGSVIIVYESSTSNIIFHVLVFPFCSVYFHNEGIRTGIWTFVPLLQFYLEEAKGRVDYQGYIFPRRRGQTVSNFFSLMLHLYINAISFVLVMCPFSSWRDWLQYIIQTILCYFTTEKEKKKVFVFYIFWFYNEFPVPTKRHWRSLKWLSPYGLEKQ